MFLTSSVACVCIALYIFFKPTKTFETIKVLKLSRLPSLDISVNENKILRRRKTLFLQQFLVSIKAMPSLSDCVMKMNILEYMK
jgi:hypothetical protein